MNNTKRTLSTINAMLPTEVKAYVSQARQARYAALYLAYAEDETIENDASYLKAIEPYYTTAVHDHQPIVIDIRDYVVTVSDQQNVKAYTAFIACYKGYQQNASKINAWLVAHPEIN